MSRSSLPIRVLGVRSRYILLCVILLFSTSGLIFLTIYPASELSVTVVLGEKSEAEWTIVPSRTTCTSMGIICWEVTVSSTKSHDLWNSEEVVIASRFTKLLPGEKTDWIRSPSCVSFFRLPSDVVSINASLHNLKSGLAEIEIHINGHINILKVVVDHDEILIQPKPNGEKRLGGWLPEGLKSPSRL